MDGTALVDLARRAWIVLVVGALLGAGAASALSLTRTPHYRAATQVYVSVPGAATTSDLAQGGNAAEQKIQSFVTIARSATVLSPVVADLGLEGGSEALARRVGASSPVDSVLIDIAVTDTDPTRAARTADAVAASLATVVEDDLERPEDGRSSFRIQTVQPADAPDRPLGMPSWAGAVLGAALGTLVGLGAAALRVVLDRRLHDRSDAEALLTAPVLGSIAFDPDTPRHPLVAQQGPRSIRAEDVRRLRTNLRFLGEKSAVYTMTSAVQGEGKSTTVANLATALSDLGLRVALVDADLRRPAVARIMGIEGEYGLTDLLVGRGELDTALQPWGDAGLHVLPSGPVPPNPTELLASPAMALVLSELRDQFDVVLVDAPPLLPVSDALVLAGATDGALLAVALHQTSRQHVAAARTALADGHASLRGVVLTKARRTKHDAYTYEYAPPAARTRAS